MTTEIESVRDNLKAISAYLFESSGPDFMFEAVEKAIAMLGSQWQPIETAPKDGDVFLSFWREIPVFVSWCEDGFRVVTPFRDGKTFCIHGNFAPFTPPAWQPLPTPPENPQ